MESKGTVSESWSLRFEEASPLADMVVCLFGGVSSGSSELQWRSEKRERERERVKTMDWEERSPKRRGGSSC